MAMLSLERPSTSRTPWLSASCGLGFGQSQLGSALLRAAELGDGGQVRRITQPTCSSACTRRLRWGAAAAALALAAAVAELRRLTAALDPDEIAGSTRIDLIVLAATAIAMALCLLAMLQCMPDPGITANWTDDYYRTALHLAAAMGHADLISILTDEGAAIDSRDWQLRTPLHYAAASDSIAAVTALLALGADRNAVDAERRRPFRVAASRTMWERLGGPDTTLHEALRSEAKAEGAEKGVLKLPFVAHLIERDSAVIDCPDQRGCPPLVLAAVAGRTDIVELLLQRGASVDLASSPAPPARRRHAAVADGSREDAAGSAAAAAEEEEEEEEEEDAVAPCTALFAATERGDVATMRALLDAGASPDVRNPLDAMQRKLREYSANCVEHGGGGGGDAPLHVAAARDDGAALALLLDRGACIEARNATRQTALAIAIVERAGDALTLLLARGASCAVDDDDEIGAGSTPLHYVAARGRLAVVQQLLAAAAESAGSAEPTAVGLRAVNALDERGFSPLHHSVRSGKLAVVRALLDAGADATLPTSLGLTAKQLAATRPAFEGFQWV